MLCLGWDLSTCLLSITNLGQKVKTHKGIKNSGKGWLCFSHNGSPRPKLNIFFVGYLTKKDNIIYHN